MDEVAVVAIVFAFIFLSLKLLLDYFRDRNKVKASAAGSSMTSSELRNLIEEAVETALGDRLTGIERRLDAFDKPQLMPASQQPENVELEHPASPPIIRDRDATR